MFHNNNHVPLHIKWCVQILNTQNLQGHMLEKMQVEHF